MKKIFATLMFVAIAAIMPAMAAVTWKVTNPTNGKAGKISHIEVEYSGAAYRYTADDAVAYIYDSSNNLLQTLDRDHISLQYKYNYVEFSLLNTLTEIGTYKLSVPANAFMDYNQTVYSPAFSVTVEVIETAYDESQVNWVCQSPEDGIGTSLETVILSSNYAWDEVTAEAKAKLYNSSMDVVATLTNSNISVNGGYVTLHFPTPITTPGSYMLIFDAGSFICSSEGVTNGPNTMVALTVSANAQSSDVTAVPANNSKVSVDTGITTIYLMVDGYSFDSANTQGLVMNITKDGAFYASVGASALSAAMDQSTTCITLPQNAQLWTEGNYVLTLPEGYFTMKNSSTTKPSPLIVLNYTITAPAEPLSWSIDPAEGTVSKIDQVKITFNKPVQAALTNVVYLFWTDYSYLPESVTEGKITVSSDGLVATIKYSPTFRNGGIFQVRLYEGNEQLSVEDGETFPGIDITYKVNQPLYTESEPAAGSTLESLQETKVFFPRNSKIEAAANFSAWYVKGNQKIKAELKELKQYDFGDPSYAIVASESPIEEGGEWNLLFDTGAFVISNYGKTMLSPETSISFKVSEKQSEIGINADEEGDYDVYSLQGIRVRSHANAADIQNLAPGLYIINGQKVKIQK